MKAMKKNSTTAATATTATISPRSTNGIIGFLPIYRNHSSSFPLSNYCLIFLHSSPPLSLSSLTLSLYLSSSLSLSLFRILPSDLPLAGTDPPPIGLEYFWDMFGGDHVGSGPVFPAFVEENRLQYDANAFPQLRLFGEFPVGYTVGHTSHMANKHTTATGHPNHRAQEAESILIQQKHLISLNNYLHQDRAGQSGSIFNPNPVSTGLKLSFEEEEHNSSVTSASENLKAVLPVISSVSDNLKIEIDRQQEEFDHFIKVQEEKVLKGVTELRQSQTASFLNAIEKGVSRKLHEKEIELENMKRKNKELMERIKQVSMEVQSWHYKAKYNESVVTFLKSNLQQVMAQGAMHGKEGCGDSEVDDAASYAKTNRLGFLDFSGSSVFTKKPLNCRACKVREVSVLLLPCRHLCLCNDCEGFIDICPVCSVMKTASVLVYMS